MRILSLLLFTGLLSACGNNNSQKTINLQADNPEITAKGKILYMQYCAECHGDNLQGQENWRIRNEAGLLPAPPHDETGHTWHHPDEMLVEMTKYGPQKYAGSDYKSDMPAYAGILSDAEIVAILSYIKSRWPENIRTRHDDLNRQYEESKK